MAVNLRASTSRRRRHRHRARFFIDLARPRRSSSQWCASIFRFHVGCRCCCALAGHSKHNAALRLRRRRLICFKSSGGFRAAVGTISPRPPQHRRCVRLARVFTPFLEDYSEALWPPAAGAGSPVSCPPRWPRMKSVLGFLGQRGALATGGGRIGFSCYLKDNRAAQREQTPPAPGIVC